MAVLQRFPLLYTYSEGYATRRQSTYQLRLSPSRYTLAGMGWIRTAMTFTRPGIISKNPAEIPAARQRSYRKARTRALAVLRSRVTSLMKNSASADDHCLSSYRKTLRARTAAFFSHRVQFTFTFIRYTRSIAPSLALPLSVCCLLPWTDSRLNSPELFRFRLATGWSLFNGLPTKINFKISWLMLTYR